MVKQKLKTGISTMVWIKLSLFITGLLFLFYVFGQTDLNWIKEVFLILIGGLVLGFVLKLYRPGSIINIIKLQNQMNG